MKFEYKVRDIKMEFLAKYCIFDIMISCCTYLKLGKEYCLQLHFFAFKGCAENIDNA